MIPLFEGKNMLLISLVQFPYITVLHKVVSTYSNP